MIRIRKSLSSKLSLSILLLAIPIFFISLGMSFRRSRIMISNESTERAISLLNITMQRVQRFMNAVVTATNVNDWLVMKYMDPDSILSLSNRIVRVNPHIDGCSISAEPDFFPQYGRYYSAYSIREGDSVISVVEEPYEYFTREWYKTPKDLGEACWVDFYDDIDTLKVAIDGMIASYCKPLYNDDGTFIGVISTDISLRRLEEVVNAVRPYPNSYFMMLGEEGRFIIHPDSSQMFEKTIFSDADPASQADIIALGHEMTNGNEGHMKITINDEPCLVCYRSVPGTCWSLAIVCPESDILKNYHRLTYIILPLLLFGVIVILLLCRRVVGHAITPINQLLKQTQTIAAGNYEVHIPRSQREDVVGLLQNSFATMLQSLNFHMGSTRYVADQTKLRNEELVQATRMAEKADKQKTTFIQNVTHQIRTPLNIIMGFSQVLRDTAMISSSGGEETAGPDSKAASYLNDVLPEEEMKSITDTMEYNSKLLNRLVLMLFDSSDSGLSEELNCRQFESVSCNAVVREAIRFTHLRYPDLPIEFQSEVPDDFCLQTSWSYLLRSLREILYNSAKYSDGQHVVVRVSVKDDPESPSVLFIIEDTGKGIAEADRDLMFKFFTKVDDLSEGLGLGLPLSKRHARNLGGDLTLDSSYHDGCRFIIELPLEARS